MQSDHHENLNKKVIHKKDILFGKLVPFQTLVQRVNKVLCDQVYDL